MAGRRSRFAKPQTVKVPGVLGTFKVPNTGLTAEYVLTYATLDNGTTAHGQLLDLLAPVREVFRLEELSFDHLLQRDLDDFRVSTQMVPYLLGQGSWDAEGRNPAGPRFFPPIVAVIVPVDAGTKIKDYYPEREDKDVTETDLKMRITSFGDVFTVERDISESGQLAQAPVDLSIHPSKAKLVIVDGQHRAMAMLATYRSALNKWGGSGVGDEFRYFYEQEVELGQEELMQLQLPVCIVYFPELTEAKGAQIKKETLTDACRKVFLDVNKSARHPSKSRQTLLDDTDVAALLTRQVFNMIQKDSKNSPLKLHHTEYDNPHDRIVMIRPFALTDVNTIFTIISHVYFDEDELIRDPMRNPSTGTRQPNNVRLRQELRVEDIFTDDDLKRLKIQNTDIKRYDYPKQAEQHLRDSFGEAWGRVILATYTKLYPFAKHSEAVEATLKSHRPYIGETKIAEVALVGGQGLRHALENLQSRDRELRHSRGTMTNAEKAWKALITIEDDFKKQRAKLYLKLRKDPTQAQIDKVTRLFDGFRSNAFQTGLFMAFACLKDRLDLTGPQFVAQADKWVERINTKFKNDVRVRDVLFDHSDQRSLRHLYKPRGGLIPRDWPFFRYVIFELLGK